MKAKYSQRLSVLGAALWLTSLPLQASSAPQSFAYEGRVYDTSGNPSAATVNLTFRIFAPDGTCLLYEETQTNLNLMTTDGYFSVNIGSAVGASQRGGNDPGLAMNRVFANLGEVRAVGSTNCSTGYTPTAGDTRRLRILVTEGGTTTTMTPDLVLGSVPSALVAETLQGKAPSEFIQSNGAVTQANLTALTAQQSAILSLADGTSTTYVKSNGGNFTPSASLSMNNNRMTNLADPTLAQDAATKNYCDVSMGGSQLDLTGLADGQSVRWNQTSSKWEAFTPFLSGTTLVVTDIPDLPATKITSGTLDYARLPVGTAANTLAAGDDSRIVGALQSSGGTLSGPLDLNGNNLLNASHVTILGQGTLHLGNLTNAQEATLIGSLSAPHKGKTWYNADTNQVRYWDGTAVQSLGAAGAGVSSLNGLTDSAQTLSFGMAGTNPAFTSGGAMHTLNIPMASTPGVTAGLLSKTEYDQFNSKLTSVDGSSLTMGQIWVGNGSNQATQVNPFGDVMMDSTGQFTVTRFQGRDVSSITPVMGQVLRFNGSIWEVANFSVSDLKTTIGTQQFSGTTCTSGQTLTWSSLSDTFDCTQIAITTAQVAGLGTAASKDFGMAIGNLVEIDGSGRIPNSVLDPIVVSKWQMAGPNIYFPGGNVGIGTNTPMAPLHVELGSSNPLVRIVNTNGGSTMPALEVGNAGTGGALKVGNIGSPISSIIMCSGSNGAVTVTNTAPQIFSINCPGAIPGSVAHCSPVGAQPNTIAWNAWAQYSNQVEIKLVNTSGTGVTSTVMTWNCMVVN